MLGTGTFCRPTWMLWRLNAGSEGDRLVLMYGARGGLNRSAVYRKRQTTVKTVFVAMVAGPIVSAVYAGPLDVFLSQFDSVQKYKDVPSSMTASRSPSIESSVSRSWGQRRATPINSKPSPITSETGRPPSATRTTRLCRRNASTLATPPPDFRSARRRTFSLRV